jgi:enoyl-CoA hydratase/carnithine racemase
MTEQPSLIVSSLGAVDDVVLNRPSRLNAIIQPMAESLLSYFEGKRRDTTSRVIVIRGAGAGFCSGGVSRSDPCLISLQIEPEVLACALIAKRAG